MENLLSGLLAEVLGHSEIGSKNNRKYVCPFHVSNPPGKKKLEIDIVTDSAGENKWACWACGEKGRTIRSLFRKMGVGKEYFSKLSTVIIKSPTDQEDYTPFNGILPPEYKFMLDAKPKDILARHAMMYLKNRNVSIRDIIKYQIGYCEEGAYAERIIIPSYDSTEKINFFVGRSFDPEARLRYKFPQVSRDIIPFELYINWDLPIILCEGVFDMMAIKRNVIPLLGKNITPKLMKRLIESKIKKVYIALDQDALLMSLNHCEMLMNMGKKVYLVNIESKDPADMGFEAFLKVIQTVPELKKEDLIKLKMSV